MTEGLGLKSLGVDTHLSFVFSFFLIFDDSVNGGKKGVILAYPYIFAGMNSRSLLADQDVPRLDQLSAKPFHAHSLPAAISAVARASSRFLVCHLSLLRRLKVKGQRSEAKEFSLQPLSLIL